ncbi:MAG: HD domain-containing protein [Anaerolineaceae bacterium]|nr:HD domain-containing protein [Anaerolineaceae bacterium]
MSSHFSFTSFQDILRFFREYAGQPGKLYVVGGAVRDYLLERELHDIDFVQPGNPRRLAKQVANELGGAYYLLDSERNTARVVLTGPDERPFVIDFASFRGEDLDQDLRRRDFTINAMAVDVQAPERLIDPLGGLKDLKARQLRPCSAASLAEDPLRILRAVRLALDLNLRLLPETIQAIRAQVSRLGEVSAERQRDELVRMLVGRRPQTAIQMLDHLGVLESLLPELAATQGVAQSPPHTLPVWEHTLAVLNELERLLLALKGEYREENAANLWMGLAVLQLGRYREQFQEHFQTLVSGERTRQWTLFLAALYHDAGKPVARRVEESGRIRFFNHEQLGEQIVEKRAQALALSQDEVRRVKLIVRNHMRIHLLAYSGQTLTRRVIYRFFRDTGEAGVDVCLLTLADTLATQRYAMDQQVWSTELDLCRRLLETWWEGPAEVIRPARLLSGDDLQEHFGLKPGKQIGTLLEELSEAQVMGEVVERQDALAWVRKKLDKSTL